MCSSHTPASPVCPEHGAVMGYFKGRVDERVIEADERSACRCAGTDPVHSLCSACQPANWLLTWAKERSRCAACAATAARVSRTRSAAIRAACSSLM